MASASAVIAIEMTLPLITGGCLYALTVMDSPASLTRKSRLGGVELGRKGSIAPESHV